MKTRIATTICTILVVAAAGTASGHERVAAAEDPPVAGTPLTQPGQAASGNAPASCTPQAADGITGLQAKVTKGTYCVCSEGAHAVHVNQEATHLKKNERVEIAPLDWVTPVKLGNTQALMIASEDKTALEALITFPHKKTQGGGTQPVTHLVRIIPEALDFVPTGATAPQSSCSRTKNVLRIRFCFKRPDGSWSCADDEPDGGHLGDTHVQN